MFPPKMLSLVAALFASAGAASAQTFTFTAVVDSINSDNTPLAESRLGLVAGDTFTAVLVLDWNAPDYDTDPKLGVYRNWNPYGYSPNRYSASLTLYFPNQASEFGGPSNSSTTPDIRVADGTTIDSVTGKLGTVSGDSFNYYQPKPQVAGPGNGLYQETVELLLNDSSGSAFSSDGLPRSLNLSDFDLAKIYFRAARTGGGISYPGSDGPHYKSFDLFATVTNITAVPEVSTTALSLLAGGILVGTRRRRN